MTTPMTTVESLTESMDLLMEVMDLEAYMVARGDYDGLKLLTERKQALGRAYEGAARTFRLDPELRATLDEETKAELARKATRFHAAMDANASMLRAKVEVGQTVVSAIVAAFNEQQLRETGYSAPKPAPRPGAGVARYAKSAPATLNQTL